MKDDTVSVDLTAKEINLLQTAIGVAIGIVNKDLAGKLRSLDIKLTVSTCEFFLTAIRKDD